jgi:hypothetical protein
MRRTIWYRVALASFLLLGWSLPLAPAQAQDLRDGKLRILGRATA